MNEDRSAHIAHIQQLLHAPFRPVGRPKLKTAMQIHNEISVWQMCANRHAKRKHRKLLPKQMCRRASGVESGGGGSGSE